MVIALLSATLIGCGGEAKKEGQYIVTRMPVEPQAIDPSRSSDLYSSDILNEITEGLVRLEQDENGGDIIKPAGAEDWDVSDDGLVWTFH